MLNKIICNQNLSSIQTVTKTLPFLINGIKLCFYSKDLL